MRLALLAALAGGTVLAAAKPQSEPTEPLTIEHILRLPVVSEFELAPDGKTLALTVSRLGRQLVVLIPNPKEPGEPLTPAKGRDREPDWSPDGQSLVFTSDRDGAPHLYLARPGDKEARQLTSHQGQDRRPRWSPDGQRIAYLSERLGGETGWDVWVTPVPSGTPIRLTRDPLDEEDPRWSPDGKWVAYTLRAGRHVERRVAVVAASGGEPRILTREDWKGDSHSPRWSPDGKRLAFVSDHGGRKSIYLVSSEGGEPKPLVTTEYEETEPVWSPDGREVAHLSNREGNLHLAVTSVEDRRTRLITRGAGVHLGPRWAPDGTALVCLFEGPLNPPDIWRFDLKQGGRSRLTESLHPELDVRQMSRPELFRYTAKDGRAISGFLYLPSEASPSKPAALVAHPHGGPTSQWRNGWHPFEQYLVQKGYALFAPNVRGSSGFGLDFENLNDRDWGRGDLDDLVSGVQQLVARPEIRDDRIGIWGVSYGGFLTLAAIGRYPELFTCAVEAVGMPDLEKLYRETNTEGRTYLDRELGRLPGNLKLYRDLSPIALVDRVKIPLLSFHGENYPLVPYSAKRPYFDALRKRRHPLVELIFQGEGARGTYRFDLYPEASGAYMEKVEEFFRIYL
jgi:dipeptidyl aminopeptidase/acylaminoacyl peptidase